MKTLLKCKSIAIIMVLSIAFFSCAKDEIGISENAIQEKTWSSEMELIKDAVEVEGEVLFSKEFDESLTEEEASALFEKDVKQFLINNPEAPKKALSTEWFYHSGFKVGSQTHNTTNGLVQSRVYFKTHRGTSWVGHNYPNGSGSRPGWKFQFSRGWYPNHAPIASVIPVSHRISVRGTDGLFITHSNVTIRGSEQSIPATGYATLKNGAYKWVRGSSANTWGHYHTYKSRSGVVRFL